MSRFVTLLLIFSFGLSESLAQSEGKEGLEKCVAIAEDTARLACFDTYAAQVGTQSTASLKAEKAAQVQAEKAAQAHAEKVAQDQAEKAEQVYAEKAAQAREQQRQKDFGLSDAAIARREAQKEAQKQAQIEAQKEAQGTQSSEPESKPAKPRKPEPENIVARVKEFTRNNRTKRVRITLDNGQVWQEIDGKPFRGSVKPGIEVTIARRPFGGYKILIPGRSASILVRRLK